MIVVINSSGQEEWESSPLTVSQGREDPAKSDMRDVTALSGIFVRGISNYKLVFCTTLHLNT